MVNDFERDPGLELEKAKIERKMEKLKILETSEGFDKVLGSILERFYNLPFETTESCSGHVNKGNPDQINKRSYDIPKNAVNPEEWVWYDFPFLYIDDDVYGDIELQEEFKKQIPDLEKEINQRHGRDVVKLELKPQIVEVSDDEFRELTWEEIKKYNLSYGLNFEIKDEDVRDHDARKILTIIWEEFWKYLGRFDGKDLPMPDFKGGDVFIKR